MFELQVCSDWVFGLSSFTVVSGFGLLGFSLGQVISGLGMLGLDQFDFSKLYTGAFGLRELV